VDDLVEQNEEAPEVKHEGFISDDKHAQRIGVQHKKFRDEERRANDLETQLGAATKKLDAVEIKEVVVPPVPDQLSETYVEDVQKRDAAIQQKTELDAGIARKAEEGRQKDEARVTQDEADLKQRIAGFDTNTVTHGLNPIEVKQAADTVIANGLSDMFSDMLLEDPDGPLLVAYLKDNPVEQDEMNRLSPLQLVTHLNAIRPKASLLKPQTSNAPDPPIVLSGGGVEELQPSWEKGAKYE
jgi:hypothetical protein